MHRPPRPCRHRLTACGSCAAAFLDLPLRRLSFALAVVCALLLLRPALLDAVRCSPTDWSVCRTIR